MHRRNPRLFSLLTASLALAALLLGSLFSSPAKYAVADMVDATPIEQTPEDDPECSALRDLRAWFIGPAVGKIANDSETCRYNVGLATYRQYDEIVSHQSLFDSTTAIIHPGEVLTLTVEFPDCAAQADLFWGQLLISFDDGQRYGERLMAVERLNGNNYCTRNCDAGQVTNWIGIHEGAVVSGVAAIGVDVDGIAPQFVRFRLNGPFNQTHYEQIAPYYFLGNTASGPNGWNTALVPQGHYHLEATYFSTETTACSRIHVNFFVQHATPTPTPTKTPTATATPTKSPTATATATQTALPTGSPTGTATSTPTPTATATATKTPTPTATATKTPTPSSTPTPTATPVVRLTIVKSSQVIAGSNGGSDTTGAPDPNAIMIDGFVRPGDTIAYTLTVVNHSSIPLTHITLIDPYSEFTDYTGVSNPPAEGPTSHHMFWRVPDLAPGARFAARFEVRVRFSIIGLLTHIRNYATVSTDQTGSIDSNTTTHIYDPILFP